MFRVQNSRSANKKNIMRIWSLHPQYLDAKGLVALWRETLLAKHVLEGRTKGYKNHPQLDRFKACRDPLNAINLYLAGIYSEAGKRGYNFNAGKINWKFKKTKIRVTDGQMEYEWTHLKRKLKTRDPKKYAALKTLVKPKAHSLFKVVEGPIAPWEVV
jgi:hypothetical protein